jgi:hypothetical protein
MNLQKNIFEKLKPLVPAHKSMAEYFGDLLFLSNDSIYRRLRGETQLTLEEIQTICRHFHISADTLFDLRRDGQITCEVSRMGNSAPSFNGFMQGICHELEKLKQAPERHIIYSGKDVPFFYDLIYPQLFAFKYYLWMQVFAQSPDFMGKEFDPIIEDKELLATAKKAAMLYNEIPSTEIWNEENINALLFQIDFYKHSKYFGSTAQIISLYNELDDLLYHIEQQAENGCKFLPGENPEIKSGNYNLFFNQVSLSDNIILVKAGDRNKVFINYSVLNFLTSHDPAFCVETDAYLSNIIKRSSQISVENIKMRSIFFNNQHERVAYYRNKL